MPLHRTSVRRLAFSGLILALTLSARADKSPSSSAAQAPTAAPPTRPKPPSPSRSSSMRPATCISGVRRTTRPQGRHHGIISTIAGTGKIGFRGRRRSRNRRRVQLHITTLSSAPMATSTSPTASTAESEK